MLMMRWEFPNSLFHACMFGDDEMQYVYEDVYVMVSLVHMSRLYSFHKLLVFTN
jgi:hypothetical protein